jgi:lipase chaperone LimK
MFSEEQLLKLQYSINRTKITNDKNQKGIEKEKRIVVS